MNDPTDIWHIGVARELCDIVNDLIHRHEEFGFDRSEPDAVNWADIRCKDVRLSYSLLGPRRMEDWSIDVFIEEASPNCRLARWLMEKLHAMGYKEVNVIAEW